MKITRGKVGAITGAGSGIGRALALELARRGCALALSDIDAVRLAETVSQAQGLGAQVTGHTLDVSDRAAVFSWAAQCRATHGSINIIFNNAGVALTSMTGDTEPADFEWLMSINFWGVVHGTQAFLPHLRASGDGHVVNISSLFGIMGMPMSSAYNASKFAVRGFTEALRMELDLEGGCVSATCIHPGGVGTNIAMASRIDPAVLQKWGVDEKSHRQRVNKMLQVTTPGSAAKQIITGVERNARRVLVGPDARRMDFLTRVLGAGYQSLVVSQVRKMQARARAAK